MCLVLVELRVTIAVSFTVYFSTNGPLKPGPRLQDELVLQVVDCSLEEVWAEQALPT